MIDNLRQYLATVPPMQRANRFREYLQWLVLRSLDTQGFGKHMAFVGGTALRIIYGTNRFSEDLDYSLIPGHELSFIDLTVAVESDMARLGLACKRSSVKDEKTVRSCFFRFADLLHPLGLSANPAQKLAVKIEVDANPPIGGEVVEYFHPGPIMFSVNHHDLPSLFSGKLHALLFRPYVKGRDYYDLMFFLSQKTPFNIVLLRNAARQTNPEAAVESVDDVVRLLKQRLGALDDKVLAADLAPFLLEPSELGYITAKNLIAMVDRNMAGGVFGRGG